MVAAVRLLQFNINSAPPGSDGGQWLAFGHQLFGGEQVKAGFQTYPPLFPFLVRILSFDDGLLTLKLLGIGSLILVCVPVYLLLRTALYPWLAAILSITTAMVPYQNEVLSFGGYPQLLGTSFLLLTIFLLLNGLNTGQRIWFLGAAMATAATASSNVLPTMVLAMSSSLIFLMWSYKLWQKGKPVFYARLRSAVLWWIVPSVILCLPFSGIYIAYFSSAERSPANPQALTLLDITHWLSSAWLWEFVLWSSIFCIAVVSFLLRWRTTFSRNHILVTAAIVVLASGFMGLFILRELRFGAYIEIGMVLIIGLLLNMLISFLSRPALRQYLFSITLIIVIVVVSVIGGIGYRRFIIAYYWYDVVDASVFPAMEWLRDNRISGARVAATGAYHGHNYGWWIEGYAFMPTYMAGDAFLFISAEERNHVALAYHLLMEDISPEEIRAITKAEGIQFFFLDKRVLPHSLDSFVKAGFVQVFNTDSIVIMSNSYSTSIQVK